MSYKFIFDTSVLDEKSVKELRHAGIVNTCSSGRFAFYATPILLKERLNFAGKGKIHPNAVEPVKLLIDLKWQRLFNEFGGPEGIFTKELEGKSQSEYLFIPHREIKDNLALFLKGGEFDDEAKQVIATDFSRWTEKKKNNKGIYRSMRQDISEKIKKDKSTSRKGVSFPAFLNINFESMIIDKIRNSINSKISKDKLVEYWLSHKKRCPYFNKYVEGYLFIAWHIMASELEPKIDTNAQDDVEHLLYLAGVDGVVSNEVGFMSTACKQLFPDKDFLSVDQFIGRIKNG